jgi:hypothetical protein
MLREIARFVYALFFSRLQLAEAAGPLLPLVLHWMPLKRIYMGLSMLDLGVLCETVPMRDKEWIARYAVRCENLELLRKALSMGVQLENDKRSLLCEAINVSWFEGIHELMQRGARWDAVQKDGRSANELLEDRYEECRKEMAEITAVVNALKVDIDACDYYQEAWAEGDLLDETPIPNELLADAPTEWDLEPTDVKYAARHVHDMKPTLDYPPPAEAPPMCNLEPEYSSDPDDSFDGY